MNWIRNTVTQSKNDFAKVLLYSFSSLMTVLDMQKKIQNGMVTVTYMSGGIE